MILEFMALLGAWWIGKIAYNMASCLRGNHRWFYWERPISHYSASDPTCWNQYRRCDHCGVVQFRYADKDANFKGEWNTQAGYITFREGKKPEAL